MNRKVGTYHLNERYARRGQQRTECPLAGNAQNDPFSSFEETVRMIDDRAATMDGHSDQRERKLQCAHHLEVAEDRTEIGIHEIFGKECQRGVEGNPICRTTDGSQADIDGEKLIELVEAKENERADGIERG